MKSREPSTVPPEQECRPSQAVHALPASSPRGPSARQSGKSDPRRNSLPDNDRRPTFRHQLNHTLTSLRGTLELALLVDLDAQEYRRAIQQSLVQTESLVQLFRSFRARAGAETPDFANEEVGLSELVRMVLERLRPLADSRRLPIHLESGDDCLVQTDPARLLLALRPGSLRATEESPTGGKFEVRLSTKEGSACLMLAATRQPAETHPLPQCVQNREHEPKKVLVSDRVERDWSPVRVAVGAVGGGRLITRGMAGAWAGEAVEDRVSDDKQETSASSERPLRMAEEALDPEAVLPVDLQASSDHLLELVADNLRQLDQPSHGAFLQRLLRGLTSVEVTERESIVHWERILARRNELTEKLRRPSSLRTAVVDYFGELQLLRKPILFEYEELEKLRHNAATDPLTGLKNRRMFEEHLAREISHSTRYGTSFALLLLDLRRFKLANDTYGHATGDEILRSVARASAETIRACDISFRIGGDEFAILLPQAERSSAEASAERIARKFELYAKLLAPDTPAGIDYGIAIFPEDGEGATKLFQTADKKLYESKQRPSRLPQDPVVTGWGSAPAVEGLVREVGAATESGDRRHPTSSV